MSILSDSEIKQLCVMPPNATFFDEAMYQELIAIQNLAGWPASEAAMQYMRESIRMQCTREYTVEETSSFKPMITPFSNGQIREVVHSITKPMDASLVTIPSSPAYKTISSGLSSYGYDVTLSDEIKLFSNINAAIVDPKDFNQACLVDATVQSNPDGSRYVILPPNSYMLGRTVETFFIPRDVMVVCLGKSTYARCFTGDTRVALVDGTSATFVELETRAAQGERLWGYSIAPDGDVVVAELTAPRKVGHERVLEVELDNGERIRATPDHKFMLRDGTWCEAKDLIDGTSLMPLYRFVARGYEAVVQPTCFRWSMTHRLADEYNLRHGIYVAGAVEHRHHKDHNRRNNIPTNIERKDASRHLKEHNAEYWDATAREEMSAIQRRVHAELSKDPEWAVAFKAKCKHAAQTLWNADEHAETREALRTALRERMKNLSPEVREAYAERCRQTFAIAENKQRRADALSRLWKDPDFRAAKSAHMTALNLRADVSEETLRAALEKHGSIRGAARELDCDRTTFRRLADVLVEFKEKWEAAKALAKYSQDQMLAFLHKYGSATKAARALKIGRNTIRKHYHEAMTRFYGSSVADNHRVIAVREVEGTCDVYCLSVPEFGNFALESGVFVKNCGVIVNVTPIEPGFASTIVLEASNSTGLPVKIYINEGFAQFLFFRGNQPCSVSYADRHGKYQGQEGIQLAKV